MSYAALVGVLDGECGPHIVDAIAHSRVTAQLDVVRGERALRILFRDGHATPSDSALDGASVGIAQLGGGIYFLAAGTREEQLVEPAGRWVLWANASLAPSELISWCHHQGFAFGQAADVIDLPALVRQLRPMAVLTDCPKRVLGLSCEQLRGAVGDGLSAQILVITQNAEELRLECEALNRKLVAAWTNSTVRGLSPAQLCQIAPFNLKELQRLILASAD